MAWVPRGAVRAGWSLARLGRAPSAPSRRGRLTALVTLALLVGAAILWGGSPAPAVNATLTVTSTADAGPGSLRAAILAANAQPDVDRILIALTDPADEQGPATIRLASPLPAITGPASLSADPVTGPIPVQIDGIDADGPGLLATAPVTVQGLALISFDVGIQVMPGGDGSRIGGTQPGEAVRIRGGGDGVEVVGDVVGVTVRGIAISGQAGLAIDLEPDVTAAGRPGRLSPPDAMDADGGPNGGQNAPLLTDVVPGSPGTAAGVLASRPDTDFQIDLYASTACPDVTSGHAERWVGTVETTTDSAGDAVFAGPLAGDVAAGEWLTATATGPDGTSEVSLCAPAVADAGGEPQATPAPNSTAMPAPAATERPAPDGASDSTQPRAGQGPDAPATADPAAAPPPLPRAQTAEPADAPDAASAADAANAADPSGRAEPGTPTGADTTADGTGQPAPPALGQTIPDLFAADPAPVEEPRADGRRSTFAAAVGVPTRELLTPDTLIRGLVATVTLVLALAFSSALFDETIKKNPHVVGGLLARMDPVLGPVKRWLTSLPVAVALGGLLLSRGLVISAVDPGFPTAPYAARLFTGVMIGSSIVVVMAYGMVLILERRRTGLWGRLHAVPIGVVVAAICVIATRSFDLVPGYVFGVTVAVSLPAAISTARNGVVTASVFAMLLPLFLSAYLLRGLLTGAVTGPDPSAIAEIADIALAFLAVGGSQYALFLLLPLRGMDGGSLTAWDKRVWLGLFAAACALFVLIVLDPRSGMWRRTSPSGVIALAIGFGLFSIGFWAYCQVRPPPPADPGTPSPAEQGQGDDGHAVLATVGARADRDDG